MPHPNHDPASIEQSTTGVAQAFPVMNVRTLFPFITGLLLSLCGGALFASLHIPLPWMLGPLLVTGIAGVYELPVRAITGGRQLGQLFIGCILGQYFSPDISWRLLSQWRLMLATAMVALAAGIAGGALLARIAGIEQRTAYFCAIPGGAAEMAVLAERAGARFDRVALAQSLRVFIVVCTVPVILTLAGATGTDSYTLQVKEVSAGGLMLLLAIALTGGIVFDRCRIPNAFILGPLATSALLTMNSINLSAVPQVIGISGQLLMGWALGARFKPDLRNESGRFLLGTVAATLLSMAILATAAALVAFVQGIPVQTMILATAPGGISEMCVTAKILKLGVPIVTSFQVTRLAFLLITALPVYRLYAKFVADQRSKL
jgi:membrane AbrB-like protein